MDGTLDIWDYLYKTSDPALSVQVSKVAQWGVSVSQGAQLLSVSGDDGATTILRLGDGLTTLQPNEKSTIAQLFDKEARREKNLETAAREAKARKQPPQGTQGAQAAQGTQAAQATQAQPAQSPKQAPAAPHHLTTPAEIDALLSDVEKEFFAAVNVQEPNGKP